MKVRGRRCETEIDYCKMGDEEFLPRLTEVVANMSTHALLEIDGVQDLLAQKLRRLVVEEWAKHNKVRSAVDVTFRIYVDHPPYMHPESALEDVINDLDYNFDSYDNLATVSDCTMDEITIVKVGG